VQLPTRHGIISDDIAAALLQMHVESTPEQLKAVKVFNMHGIWCMTGKLESPTDRMVVLRATLTAH
jgi:hypothetical protein